MWRQSRYVTSAALEEAALLGHPELGQEHLLLGLLVTGGPGAALLTGAGVDLPGLRRAVAEVQQRDLAPLGVQVPAPAAPDGPEPSFRAAQAIPFNDRAMAVMKRISYEGDDRELLLALLDDEDRRAERVLEHLGADVGALRAASAPDAPPPGSLPAPAATGPGSVVAHVQDVPVDAARVWDVVSDVRRRPEWDETCVRVEPGPDGAERLTHRWRRREVVVEQVVTHLVPGREIAWRLHRAGSHRSGTFGVRVEPVGTTCRVHLETGPERRTLLGRVLHPLVVRMAGSRLRWQAQAIARAAAR